MKYTVKNPMRIGLLISGRGSNMEVIIRKSLSSKNIKVECVISDRKEAKGLKVAKALNIDIIYLNPGKFKTKLSEEAEKEYIDFLKAKEIDLVCLCGFMRVVKVDLIQAFKNRILNIHPSLLPRYKGLNVHKRVLFAGEKESGCTIHLVNEEIDGGRILAQRKVKILAEETEESLSKKVLEEEHKVYFQVIEEIANGKIKIDE